MTEQTIQSQPAVQQASAPYTYEERIGNRWAPTLLYTIGASFVAAAILYELYPLMFVGLGCVMTYSFVFARRPAQTAPSDIKPSYKIASNLIYMIAIIALLEPAINGNAQETWRLIAIIALAFTFSHWVMIGYHPIERTTHD
ncbi:hypothetical protein [Rothia nasimurium]|uniref:hypothetical protein n=1 Tax=Rothia nasimurium TaxID=85336 RepID=UPI001F485378|nr:hypothetical protein [Rothia nasimurium]